MANLDDAAISVLALAFPFFKSVRVWKGRLLSLNPSGDAAGNGRVVVLVVTFTNVFTIIQPVIEAGDWNSALDDRRSDLLLTAGDGDLSGTT